jgi:segregation and condensation protein B
MKNMNGHDDRRDHAGSPGDFTAPGDPGDPDIPDDPGVPEIPGDPGVPDAPGYPGVPGIPGDPGVPELPGDPGVSDAPGDPGDPGILGDPGAPGDPDVPDTPGDPDDPGGPSLRAGLEAILLVADEPVPAVVLAQVLERPTEEVSALLRDTAAAYAAESRGFDLREIAGGWRFYTREECAPVVERFVSEGQEVRLTQAALETLAVVAYRQPVSRARVSAVRGVNCDGVMRTLTLRGLVEDAGTDRETGAILYRTTGYFLERLGLASLAELPDLAPFLPDSVEDVDETMDVGHERARP